MIRPAAAANDRRSAARRRAGVRLRPRRLGNARLPRHARARRRPTRSSSRPARLDADAMHRPTSACSTSPPRGWTSGRRDRLYSSSRSIEGDQLGTAAIAAESPCCCRATMRKRRSRATVAGFRAALPGATVYVYDNNSRDRHARGRREGRRDRPHRAPAGQGPRRPPHVRRRRRRHLCHGRRRPDLRSQGRAGDGRACCSPSSSTWSSAPAGTRRRRPIAAATCSATRSSPACSPACSGAASAISSPATGSSRAAS